jgi:hypothetical protein
MRLVVIVPLHNQVSTSTEDYAEGKILVAFFNSMHQASHFWHGRF